MDEDTIMEVREDFMLSPTADSKPTFRKAHFLKPISNSIDEQPPFKFNPFSSFSSSVSQPMEWPLTIRFNGWRSPQTKWFRWVDQLKLKHESLWKKVGIFEAIMSTRCRINKSQDLLYGVVEKWCCETNTFVFPFGEATITLEDIMLLGGYPVLGDPVFISLEDQQMKEIEEKLDIARKELSKSKTGKARASIWMDIFIDKDSEIEHEAFLTTWLSIFVFPHKSKLVKTSLFPIVIHLARGNPIALAPAVLASIYKDLNLLKKTIVDLKKYHPVGGERFPLEVTLASPFYLVQIWVWERFKKLQPQPQTMMINHGEPLLFRWHRAKAPKINTVRLAIDSGISDFLWRPYVKYADKCGKFYRNDDILVPFKNVLVDRQMLSFVICMRVSELVGFDSIEQYLPHRVAMQFGMDQDVPSYVPRFNETKDIAWKNYYRPISDENLNFPLRFFEAGVTARYARWWKQSVLEHGDIVKKIVQRKRSASSRKHRTHVGKANRSDSDIGAPPGFPLNLLDSITFGNFCYDGSKTKTRKVDDLYADVPYETQGESQSKSISIRKKVSSSHDMAAHIEAQETVREEARDDEVMVFLKEQNLKNQKELAILGRQQEEMLRLMALRDKRDEELRELLTSFLRNQQPPPQTS
ncbi:protein MAIN-LIKE 2-like [Lathyrus oleraceus]|uniref:protein MAIN-LIKE 2-like n=1 Tax=Pisum sativum TaxID=3888 RepID=UPI0021CE7D28|nr:protein MAIN-LIKE 2-like [Pisum sativum]